MADNYKIQLGVDLKTGDIRKQISAYNQNSNNAKLKLGIKLDTADLKKQINQLNLGGKGVDIPLNTTSLENSLKEVKGIIADIKTSLGVLGDGKGMKDLLSSVNQIAAALGRAENESDSLVKSLSALSKKDFSFNIGLDMGNKNNNMVAYGRAARKQVIPELESQIKYLENLFGGQQAAMSKLTKYGGKIGFDVFTDFGDFNSDSAIKKMEAMEKYINSLKRLAAIDNVKLDGFNEIHRDASELINDITGIENAVNKAGDIPQKLNSLFGSGISSDQLDSIVADLKEIKTALTDLSAQTPLNQLKTSFDSLSKSITQLIQNCGNISAAFNDIGNAGRNIATNVGSEFANDFNNGMDSIQASATETSGVITDLKTSLQKMKLDRSSIDAITKDIEELGFEVTDASVKMKNGNFDITVKGIDDIGRTVTEIRHLNSATKEISGVSRTISQSFKEVDAFAKQQKRAVTDLTNQINQLNRAAVDQNAARPIKEDSHLDSLKSKYNEIISAIERMGVASNDTFEDERNKVKTLISEYKSLKSEYKNAENVALQMDGNDFASGLEIAKNKLAEFKSQAQGFSQLTPTIKELDAAIKGVGDVSSLKDFNNQLRVAKSELSKVKAETRSVGEIRFKLADSGFNGFEQEVKRAHTAVNALKSSTPELQLALRQLDAAMDAINSADKANDVQRLVVANKDYEVALKQVYSQLKLNQQTENNAIKEASFEKAKEGALLRLKGLFNENSQAAKIFGSELDRIQRELNECGDTKGLARINREITNLGREIKNSGAQTQTFGQRLRKQFQQYTSYLSVYSLFSYGTQALRSMFEQVKLIDSAMTELKKVTNETDAAYSKFLSNAATRSREIGTTIDGLVSSTADFARLGYGFEDAQGLAEVANIYAVVGDEIEGVKGATESLISTMAAFKDEMNGMSNTDFAMSIIDKFNEIGNNFAISSGGIGEALERSASSLMAANNTIDESIALITAANTVVQDPEAVGKWLADIKSGYIG